MVHKKSEYKLQYHHLTKDLRKEIWQQNIKFRELHRSLNQAHHYWTYQVTDDKCECDSDHEQGIPVHSPLHRVKHTNLAGHNKSCSSDSCSQKSGGDAGREIGCQTPDWKGEGRRMEEPGSSSRGGSPPERHAAKNPGTPNVAAPSREALLPAERPQSSRRSFSPSLKETTPPHCLRREKTVHSLPVKTTSRSRSPTRFAQLSRTSRKAFCEERNLPFTSYGWNDSRRNVGEKKTYNICAPEVEVYQPALRAHRQRREEIEDYLKSEAASSRWDAAERNVVNHSSIWMSEYQEQFSHKAARAKSAPPLRKTSAWC